MGPHGSRPGGRDLHEQLRMISSATSAGGSGSVLALVEHPRNFAAHHGLLRLRDRGYDLVLVTANPSRYGITPGHPDSPLAAFSRVIRGDTRSPMNVARLLAPLAANLFALHSFSHYYCEVAAAAARLLEVPGNDPDAIRSAVSKDRFRRLAAGAPWSLLARPASSLNDAWGAARAIGLPVVVKPVDGVSSTDVLLVRNRAQLEDAWARIVGRSGNAIGVPRAARVLVEEFAVGPGCSVELLRTPAGVQAYGVTQKLPLASQPFVEQADTFGWRDPGPDPWVEHARAALEVLPGLLGPIHVELVSTDGVPRVIEVNPRQGGGFLPVLIELVTGRNVFVEGVEAIGGRNPEHPTEPLGDAATWWQFYAWQEGRVTSVRGPCGPLADHEIFQPYVGVGDQVLPPSDNRGCIGSLIALGASREQALARARLLADSTEFIID